MSQRPSSRHGASGMARPGSRGGGMPGPSMPAPSGMAANPYQQPVQQAGMMPGAGGFGPRPGTGARPGSGMRQAPGSRQGTAAQKNLAGVGLNTQVNVEHRPVTQQGMRGSTAVGSRAGPGRQIQDRSLYLGELRARCTAVEEETAKIQARVEETKTDNASYGALEKRYENLSNEMRTLQGQLADYNLLLDRSRVGKEPADVFDEVAQLKAANSAESDKADAVFNERQRAEAQLRDLEHALYDHSQRVAERMAELPADRRELFARLQEEKGHLLTELPKKQAALVDLRERAAAAEAAVGRDSARAELARMREQSDKLSHDVDRLQALVDEGPQTAEQARNKLLAEVKSHNQDIAAWEKAIVDHQDTAKKHKAQLKQVEEELQRAGGAAQAAAGAAAAKEEKFEQLQARDAEMQQLIDTFEETRAEEQQRLDGIRANVATLLRSISQTLDASTAVGTQDASAAKLDELKGELAFKADQMEHAERTASRLVQEKEKRRAELDKIKTLDAKISHELAQLSEKMTVMADELATFRDIKKLRDDADAKRTRMSESRGGLRARVDAGGKMGVQRKQDYERAKAALAADDTASSLEALEQKLRHYESTVFMLSEYINAKSRESDFDTMKRECENMMNAVNTAESLTKLGGEREVRGVRTRHGTLQSRITPPLPFCLHRVFEVVLRLRDADGATRTRAERRRHRRRSRRSFSGTTSTARAGDRPNGVWRWALAPESHKAHGDPPGCLL
eukprot:CAMPEP_0185179444 /NCGR_PEP_ID=MMETSP1139-20130426/32011_1 /TAXON_ID=298111 /ORGANISM="Pavlova sp., Strain CCMP459" /LENGTH=739 /DNA_ID=CAMNT_0027745279 /DNA_START=1 /DNA_END=2221 /DNA_ORIENTATION=-